MVQFTVTNQDDHYYEENENNYHQYLYPCHERESSWFEDFQMLADSIDEQTILDLIMEFGLYKPQALPELRNDLNTQLVDSSFPF